jgi:hypothetical protein
MAVSGVRSSCDTFATKSRRIWSARRRSVMSCITTTTPWAASPVAGAARAMIVRDESRGGDSWTGSGVRWSSAAATSSAMAG